jgi:Derlin-2/3
VFFKDYIFTTKIFPQLWRPLTAFLITKPKFAILLDPYFCYQYGSGLERESPRFSQPGDFFTYTAFCATVIVVSSCFLHTRYVEIPPVASTARLRLTRKPRNICPRSLQILAVAVPGIEEDYPCTSHSSVIHIILKGTVVVA